MRDKSQTEFEEKTYENYFNAELNQCTKMYFPIGQVQEGKLGFDCSAYIDEDNKLWQQILEKNYPDGIELKKIAEKMEEIIGKNIDGIPDCFQTNILFQYKRPEHIISDNSKEWKNWAMPYFRYKIQHKQQDLLMKINEFFEDKVLIIYASPAFHTTDKLVEAKKDKKIISLSNFCEASKLNGHRKNTYIKEGGYSIACSKPKSILNFDLTNIIIRRPTEKVINNDIHKRNKTFIINFGKDILSVIQENKYFTDLRLQLHQYQHLNKYELLYSHIILSEIRKSIGLQWLVK